MEEKSWKSSGETKKKKKIKEEGKLVENVFHESWLQSDNNQHLTLLLLILTNRLNLSEMEGKSNKDEILVKNLHFSSIFPDPSFIYCHNSNDSTNILIYF